MKVAFYGNICNNFYMLAKCLRNNGIADAHLYLNSNTDIQNRPESDDPQLIDNYPDWIHKDDLWDPFLFLKRWDKKFINELNKYDAVFLSDLGVMLAPYIKSKTIFFVTGGDLTRIPFASRYMQDVRGLKAWIFRNYVSRMQRRGIKKCNKIITQPFYPFTSALEKLKIPEVQVSKNYYPFLIDTAKINAVNNAMQLIDKANKKQLDPYKFIIFHPSRLFIEKKNDYVETGHWKGNDNLFKAFALFLKKYAVADACIAMPERDHSPDINLAKQIISDLGIENNIVWLKPPAREGFPRNELIKYYSLSNLVVDEIATGWFGLIVLEGMACSKPSLCYVDDAVMKQLYPSHPILSSNDLDEVAEIIASIYFNKAREAELGMQSRQWIEQYHSFDNGISIYTENLKKDLQNL